MSFEELNLDNYEYVWSLGGHSYFFFSFWLDQEYPKYDFVIFNIKNKHELYVSKEQRKILSSNAVKLFAEDYDEYERKVEEKLKQSDVFFEETKNKDLTNLSDVELADDFEKTIEKLKPLFSQYFWTECFHMDKIAEIIETNDKNYDVELLKKNADRMGKSKFKQREYLNRLFYKGSILENHYAEIKKRLGLGENMFNYHYKEIIQMLKGDKINIPDRTYVVKGKFSGQKDILGEDAQKIAKQLKENLDANLDELKGKIGNKGYYKGKVKIIHFSSETDFSKEIKEMEKGDVLVSCSTGPEMILACNKAGAIVTDEGGITSHAAIVSRELRIPSIVGTKHATKIFKNGDLIEVDADKGIVRVLKE